MNLSSFTEVAKQRIRQRQLDRGRLNQIDKLGASVALLVEQGVFSHQRARILFREITRRRMSILRGKPLAPKHSHR